MRPDKRLGLMIWKLLAVFYTFNTGSLGRLQM